VFLSLHGLRPPVQSRTLLSEIGFFFSINAAFACVPFADGRPIPSGKLVDVCIDVIPVELWHDSSGGQGYACDNRSV
jgi:hypothetical protein